MKKLINKTVRLQDKGRNCSRNKDRYIFHVVYIVQRNFKNECAQISTQDSEKTKQKEGFALGLFVLCRVPSSSVKKNGCLVVAPLYFRASTAANSPLARSAATRWPSREKGKDMCAALFIIFLQTSLKWVTFYGTEAVRCGSRYGPEVSAICYWSRAVTAAKTVNGWMKEV